METRPTGITVIGVLNIVFGALGALSSLLLVLGGGFIAALAPAAVRAGAEGGAAAPAAGGAVAAIGGATIVLGVIFLLLGAVQIVSGIGVLKLAPWGWTLTVAIAGLSVLANIAGFFVFGPCNLIGLIYPAIVLALFLQPAYKNAFVQGSSYGGGMPA